jgi:hypothetical protein
MCVGADRAPDSGFRKYIVSATTPFRRNDFDRLRYDAPTVVRERVPDYESHTAAGGWKMLPSIERVYVNERARDELG